MTSMLIFLLALASTPYRASVATSHGWRNALGWARSRWRERGFDRIQAIRRLLRKGGNFALDERGAFTIPNEGDAGVADQAEVDAVDWGLLASAGPKLTGVVSGCEVTRNGATQVDIAAGVVRIQGRRIVVAGGTQTLGGATDPSYDLIYIDTVGDDLVLAGTEDASNPVFPTTGLYDSDGNEQLCLLAAVRVDEAGPSLADADIIDKRIFIDDPPYEDVRWYGAVGNVTTDDYQAIQDAIDAATVSTASGAAPRAVFLNGYDFAISDELVWPAQSILVGSYKMFGLGDTVTRLMAHTDWAPTQNAHGAFLVKGIDTDNTPTRGFEIANMMLGRNEASTAASEWRNNGRQNAGTAGLPLCGGLYLRGYDKLRLRNVKFQQLMGPAIAHNGAQEDDWQGVDIEGCGLGVDDGYITAASGGNTILTIGNRTWADDCLIGCHAMIIGGSQHAEVQTITDNGSNNQITVGSAFSGDPTGSEVAIIEANAVASATSTVITPGHTRDWTADQWIGYWVTIVSGTGRWQTRQITDNTGGAAATFTVGHAFDTTPDATSEYIIYKPAAAVYCDEAETGAYYAPAGELFSHIRWAANRGPDFLTYTTKTATHMPRSLSFNMIYQHAAIPPAAPGFWPFSSFYLEDCREVSFGQGSIGRSAFTGDDFGIDCVMAPIHIANGKHHLQSCVISRGLLITAVESKSGSTYGAAFTCIPGTTVQNGIVVEPVFTQCDPDAFDQLVYIDDDAFQNRLRPRIDPTFDDNYQGKVVSLNSGARVLEPPHCRLHKSAAQTIGGGSWTAIAFGAERWDTDNMHDTTGGDNTKIIINTPGLWLITGSVQWATDGTPSGTRRLRIVLNGTTTLDSAIQFSGGDDAVPTQNVATIYPLDVGDYVELEVWQDSGGNLDVNSVSNASPEFSASLLRP